MTTLKEFRSAQHRQVSAEVIAALKAVGDKFGIDFRTNGGNIGAGGGMIKLEVNLRDSASGKSQAKIMWDAYCHLYGLAKEDFGAIFHTGRDAYKITGINRSAPKYPIMGERLGDRKGFKFPASTVKFGLPKKAA